MGVFDYNLNPANNLEISGTDISEGCNPAGVNNALRQLMADIRSFADVLGAFTPEAYGAVGDGVTDDTAAINSMLHAAVAKTADGPVSILARGTYLVDQLDEISFYAASGDMPLAQDSIYMDFKGARFIHSGTGDGILPLEGVKSGRWQIRLEGGIFNLTSSSRWGIRGRDLRSSSINPELVGNESFGVNTIGIFPQIWRSWSELCTYGSKGANMDLRRNTNGMRFAGAAESWASEAYWLYPSYFPTGSNNISPTPATVDDPDYHLGADTTTTDAAAVAEKGSSAATGDYYKAIIPGHSGWRVHNGTSWMWGTELLGAVFAFESRGYVSSDPASLEMGHLWLDTVNDQVKVYDGTTSRVVLNISGVDTAVSLRSYARTKVFDMLLGQPSDPTAEGQAIYCHNASIYGSEISGIRGVANNDGGSLIYWDVAFAPNTKIEEIDVEKARDATKRKAVAIRLGPNTASNFSPPDLFNIYYSTSRGMKADPNAGLIVDGMEREDGNLTSTTAGTEKEVFAAGVHHSQTSYILRMSNLSNTVHGLVQVSRNNNNITRTLTITELYPSVGITWSNTNDAVNVTTVGAETLVPLVTVQRT